MGAACAGGALGYLLMLQVRDFLSLEFSQEHKAGKTLTFPTCMNFFLSGKVTGTSKLLFSPGPFPVFLSFLCCTFNTERPCCSSWQ